MLLALVTIVLAADIIVTHDQTLPDNQAGENTIRGFIVSINSSPNINYTLTNITKHSSVTCTNAFVYNLTGAGISGFSVGNVSFVGDAAWMNFTLRAGHNYAIGCGVNGDGGTYTMQGNFGSGTLPDDRKELQWNTSFYRLGTGSKDINRVDVGAYNILNINVNNGTVPASPIPLVTAINCTVCNVPAGDTTEPYTTSDTTPTFSLTTDTDATCRIGATNVNYSTMGSSRNCATTGSTSHTCTLTTQDELGTSNPTIYASCAAGDTETVSNSSAKLPMDITSLSTTILDALDQGIQTSLVWPGATIYSSQQVYLRNLANTQALGTVDRVVVSGSQRWIFNVGSDTEAPLGLFNITPAVYSLELINVSSSNIQSKVSALINATKR